MKWLVYRRSCCHLDTIISFLCSHLGRQKEGRENEEYLAPLNQPLRPCDAHCLLADITLCEHAVRQMPPIPNQIPRTSEANKKRATIVFFLTRARCMLCKMLVLFYFIMVEHLSICRDGRRCPRTVNFGHFLKARTVCTPLLGETDKFSYLYRSHYTWNSIFSRVTQSRT